MDEILRRAMDAAAYVVAMSDVTDAELEAEAVAKPSVTQLRASTALAIRDARKIDNMLAVTEGREPMGDRIGYG